MQTPDILYKLANNEATEAELRAFSRYLSGLTDTEYQAVLVQYGDIVAALDIREPADEGLYRLIEARTRGLEEGPAYAEEDMIAEEEMDEPASIAPVHPRIERNGRVYLLKRFRWVAAAVFIFAISLTVFLVNRNKPAQETAGVQKDIKAPETNKATITLPNGKTIMLDTVANGTLIAGIARKTADGQLVFEGNASDIAYIITSNPRNSKAMFIELPDHTQVWLNSDTRLQYPTNYNEKDRLVTLSGEAYFEVKHNAAKLFKVSAGEESIEDIGTSFNVKAYNDEKAVKTTLLEGEVKIHPANGGTVTLRPGQQFSNNKTVEANIDEVMAWKNGSFYLDGREFGEVANELGRWYDVEIVFNNAEARHSIVFGGEMGRNLTLNEVVEILKKMKVKCRLEGQKLTVE
jgi:ferric-dicitrate binding protein FerR (iron transport regulator)